MEGTGVVLLFLLVLVAAFGLIMALAEEDDEDFWR
jgi:Na+-transporting methylmalonyl-CoA/oxaloacetate decarboxylase gamma subunit